MANFSKDPLSVLTANAAYVGVLIEQGVPVLDRDLNLRAELPAEVLRRHVRNYLGSGTPTGAADQFKIAAADPETNDFVIQRGADDPGRILVEGVEVEITAPELRYTDQFALHPELEGTPLALEPLDVPPGPRFDCVYIDVWFDEVDSADDPSLYHPDEYEIETSVRLRRNWVVRVHKGSSNLVGLVKQPGHRYLALAYLQRQGATITADMVHDLRVTDLGLPAQAAQITDALAMQKNLHSWLAPRFHARPYGSPSAHVGMRLQIHGANFDLGGVTVEFGTREPEALDLVPDAEPTRAPAKSQPTQSTSHFQLTAVSQQIGVVQQVGVTQIATWQLVEALRAAPLLTAAQLALLKFVPAELTDEPRDDVLIVEVPAVSGYAHVAVTNELGRTICQRSIFVYGPPVWAPPGKQFATYQRRPAYAGGKLALLGANFDLPGTVVEVSGNGTDWGPVTVVDATPLGCVVNAQKWAGEYWYRVKNFAGPDFVQSTDRIKVVKP